MARRNGQTERGKRTIAIDAELVTLLLGERERYLRLMPACRTEQQSTWRLSKLPKGALMFPNPPATGEGFSFTKLRNPRNTTKEFVRKAIGLGFPGLRFHDLARNSIARPGCAGARRRGQVRARSGGNAARLCEANEEGGRSRCRCCCRIDEGRLDVNGLRTIFGKLLPSWVQLGSKSVAVAKTFTPAISRSV
jgi:hypothetical protein